MPKNPKWTKDELILALDLYFKAARKQLIPEHEMVVELSSLLKRLPIYESHVRDTDFRNLHSVSMKLGNFLSIDPEHEGKGLSRGSKLDRVIWNEFVDSLSRLHQTADAIRTNAEKGMIESRDYLDTDQENEEFIEGKILTHVHKKKERNKSAVWRKKKKVYEDTGFLACEACGFDFENIYGKLGEGYAECHHKIPISELGSIRITRVSDLAIVCSNCHRMIHKSKPMLTIEALRKIIK